MAMLSIELSGFGSVGKFLKAMFCVITQKFKICRTPPWHEKASRCNNVGFDVLATVINLLGCNAL
jgi:hypothetical protein